MQIYQAEKDAGLTELLSAKSSIVYASLAEKSEPSNITKEKIKENKALAGIEDTDLYYTQSILVTTSWNKNDDIFDPKEVWDAKSTPTHKPTNLEHNENIIVGHITSNWPIDDDGKVIDNNTTINELPKKYHILTGSVIYKGFTEPELRDRTSALIDEIESGKKYVSMECFFRGFDYGLINKTNGSYHILPRNEETAFLTKHLRAYGGAGEHQDYKIGRVLRGITFSGKGFVNRPANPESIIFTKDDLGFQKNIEILEENKEKNINSVQLGVFSNQANLKETIMSVESNTTTVEEVATIAEAPVAEVIVETQTVETEVVNHEEAEAAKKTKDEEDKKDEEMKSMKAALEVLQAELASANEALAAYKNKEAEMAKKEKKMQRKASLVESGIDSELAEAAVEQFDSLSDEAFSAMTALVAAKKKAKVEEVTNEKDETSDDEMKEMEKMNIKKKASVNTAEASVLETAEVVEEVNLSVGSDEDSSVQSTRAALVDFVCIRLGKKLNKGE